MDRNSVFGKKLCIAALMTGFAFLIAGCRSGGVPPYIPAAVPAVQTELTVSGTAAAGLALAGATVGAKCRAGNGASTSNADGTYILIVAGGQPPCMLEVTKPADGSRLHVVVTGSGDSVIANISPLTEMVTARVLRNDPAAYYAAFDGAAAPAIITAASVAAAQADVRTALADVVDTGFLDDFIGVPIRAATPDNIAGGDAHDKLLDIVGARFNSVRLAQVVAALAGTANATDVKQVVAALAAPLAIAGTARSVAVGAMVSLDGSTSSSALGRTLSYAWTLTTKPSGSSAVLAASNSPKPTFTADLAGTYVASLTVSDGILTSSASTVTMTAGIANSATVLPATYSDNGDGTVTDPATGLMWMRCSMGQTWTGVTCDGIADTYTWDVASTLPITTSFAGQSDWRLPNMRELQTIVDRAKFNPAVDSAAFPNTPASSFWSSTTYPDISTGAWNVNFGGGDVHGIDKGATLQVRLVRAGQSSSLRDSGRPASDFVDNGDGTVSHMPTGLTWKRCAEGQNWVGTSASCEGNASALAWDAAMSLTSATLAGKNDWRLPTAEEIEALVGYGSDIIASMFPNSPLLLFWSASAYAGDPNSAWGLGFGDGECYNLPMADAFGIRLVRSK